MADDQVDELARRLGVNAEAIRAHLKEMEIVGSQETHPIDKASAADLLDKLTNEEPANVNATTSPREAAGGAEAGHRLTIPGLSLPVHLDTVLRACRNAADAGTPRITLDFHDADGFFPNVVVPVVAIADHYRRLGLDVQMTNLPAPAMAMRISSPLRATTSNLENEPTMARVWQYADHREANSVTTAIVSAIRNRIECSAGVAESLEWCLCEVLDNVTQHSQADSGFVMVQHHGSSKRIAVCVADTGIGIQRSLASSAVHRPKTAFDALTLAIREGVTRNSVTNQGNGLFGLFEILSQNKGRLNIRSGRGSMRIEGTRITGDSDQVVIGADNHGTVVDFQLSAVNPIDLKTALNYDHANLFLESLENDSGEHVVVVRDQAGGAGSRPAAKELRTFIQNVLNEGAPYVVLDFTGQNVVSSSFADEVVGKFVAELGFVSFSSKIRLINMNDTVRALLDRSISLRVSTLRANSSR